MDEKEEIDWRVPFWIGLILGIFCLFATISNLIYYSSELLGVVIWFIGAIAAFGVSYFGGWRKRPKKEEIKEVKDVGNIS